MNASWKLAVRRAVTASVAAAVMAGCASGVGQPQSSQAPSLEPEQAVRVRAQERWDALVKSDVATAYGYLSPASRALNSVDAYRATIRAGFWKAAKVDKVTCASPDSCQASVTVEYEFRGNRLKSPVAETWIRSEGNWWYVLK